MEKSKFIRRVAKKHHFKIYKTEEYLNAFLDEIAEVLTEKDRLCLSDFGVFRARREPEAVRRNPRTQEHYIVPERTVIKFKASKKLNEFCFDKSVSEDQKGEKAADHTDLEEE